MSKSNSPINSENTPSPSAQQSFLVRLSTIILNENVAWIVLFITLLLTFWAWLNAENYLAKAQQTKLESRAAEVSDAILTRMQGYEHVLRGGVGLFTASKSVEREEWRDYVASLKTQENYPGIQGIGFSVHIPAARLDAHLRAIRAEGFPDYALRPAGVRDEYTSIIYLEPFDSRNQRAFGFDMFSEATRRMAMERARDTGDTVMSAKVTLVQETGKEVQAGMLMYLPYYKTGTPHTTLAERRANLVGYVYSPFRLNDLMNGILGKQHSHTGARIGPDIDIEIYDGTQHSADSLLYDEDKIAHALGKPPAGSLTLTNKIDLYGNSWSLHFTTLPEFHTTFDLHKPLLLLLSGTILSLLLSGLIWLFATQRRRALELASDMTKDLQDYKTAQDSHSIISVADVQGNILEVNLEFIKISGYSEAELLGKNHRILKSGEHSQAFYEEMWSDISSGKAWHGQIKNRKKDGSFYWVEASITPILDENGLPKKYISVRTDITQIKELEYSVQTSEQRLRRGQLFGNIGTWDWSIASGDLYWSESIWHLFGYTQDSFVPSYDKFLAAVHPEDRQKLIDAINASVAHGAAYDVEHRCVWPDGTVRWLLERGDVVRAADGSPSHMLGVVQDITERKQAQDEILLLNADLEKRVLRRTEELYSQTIELQLARETADTANLAKSQFLANMSHEIRTPMNSVIGMSYLALQAETDPKQRGYLTNIQNSAQNLMHVINEILDFSKIEAGMLELYETDFLLELTLAQINSQLSVSASNKGVKLTMALDPALSQPLRGDALRIGQVLTNLIGNAIKFTAQGEISVRAKMLSTVDEHIKVRFEVQDSGVGMTPKEVAGLFQAFHQVDASITRKYGGTGLGLTISKRLVELMGGEIGVDSQAGKGSTFWFSITLGVGTMAALEMEYVHIDLTVLSGARILVADDVLVNQLLATELLEMRGALVTVANNGQEAVQLMLKQPFDCVLMDMQMPVMDGLEATRQIRANPMLANTCIIAMTANARNEDRLRCEEAGMNDFIAKPIDPKQLYARLAKYLGVMSTREIISEINLAAAVNAGDSSVIDLAGLEQTWGKNRQKIIQYAKLFTLSMQDNMKEIEAALAHGDLPALNGLGHSAKSSARTVGAMGYGKLSDALEQCKNGDALEQARAIIAQMRPLLAKIVVEIDKLEG